MLRLTKTERQILPLILNYRSNKEIASEMGVATCTARFHVCNILHKHGVRYRADLFRKLAAGRNESTKEKADD